MGNNQTIPRCGDWKDTESYRKQIHSDRIVYYDDKTSSVSSKSHNSTQSNLSSLVAQSMMRSTKHYDIDRSVEKTYADHSSMSVQRQQVVDNVSSPELHHRSSTFTTEPYNGKSALDSNKIGDKIIPTSSFSSSAYTRKELKTRTTSSMPAAINASHEDSTHTSHQTYDYSSVAESIDFIRNELKNMKLQMARARKEQEALSHRAIVAQPTLPVSAASTTHGVSDGYQQLQQQNTHNQSTTKDIKWNELQERIRHVLDEKSQTGSSFLAIPSTQVLSNLPNNIHSSQHLHHQDSNTMGDDLSYLTDDLGSNKMQSDNLDLEIMKLDLDGDLLSVDLMSRTPRADDEISRYIRILYKTGSDLTDDDPIILPIEELEFRTMDDVRDDYEVEEFHTGDVRDDDLTSGINRNEKQGDRFDRIEHEYHEFCHSYSDDSLKSTLCAQNIHYPPSEFCLSGEYPDIRFPSLTPELDQLEKIKHRSGRECSYISDDELDAILECSEDEDEDGSIENDGIHFRHTIPMATMYDSQSRCSQYSIDAIQPNVLTRDLVFERECDKKWQPHLFAVSSGCARCIYVANKTSVDDYNLFGHSKDITSTTGGCPDDCPYFHSSEVKNKVRLCQHCFDFLHHNPFSLHRQSVKKNELPRLGRKSINSSPIKK